MVLPEAIKRLTPRGLQRSRGVIERAPRPPKAPKRPHPERNASPDLLRNLISLHHTSASFLHDEKGLPHGFDNAFQHTHNEPVFTSFQIWRDDTLRTSTASTSNLGIPDLIPRKHNPNGFDEFGSRRKPIGRPVMRYSKVFEKSDSRWSESRDSGLTSDLSERELQVKEALFGIWDRGGKGMRDVEPGLEGVLEYLEAKGVSAEDFAREWSGKGEEQDIGMDREKRIEEERERQERGEEGQASA